eukprot:m.153972 g.153972  ORF g.153972 m.153972 type:complete len:170 (+) comp16247_c2_seq1:1068-1577(+)
MRRSGKKYIFRLEIRVCNHVSMQEGQAVQKLLRDALTSRYFKRHKCIVLEDIVEALAQQRKHHAYVAIQLKVVQKMNAVAVEKLSLFTHAWMEKQKQTNPKAPNRQQLVALDGVCMVMENPPTHAHTHTHAPKGPNKTKCIRPRTPPSTTNNREAGSIRKKPKRNKERD